MSPQPLLRCTGCETRYDVGGRAPGKRVRCPRCRTVLTVPDPAAVSAAVQQSDTARTASDRLRRAKGPTCARHRRRQTTRRCAHCSDFICPECQAEPPVEHFCAKCAKNRGLGGALPLDFGLGATLGLALRGMFGSLFRGAVWNVVATLLAVAVFALPILISVKAFDEVYEGPGAATSVGPEALAGVALILIVGTFLTQYAVLVPAGCSVFVDMAIRGRRPAFGAAMKEAFGRVLRNAVSLFVVLLVQVLLFVLYLLLVLAAAYWVRAASEPLAILVFLLGAGAGFFALVTGLGLAVPVVMLEERSGTAALGRAWELVSQQPWSVASLILAWCVFYGVYSIAVYVAAEAGTAALGSFVAGAAVPVILVNAFVDVAWPALLVAMYHGLAAEDAGVVGRR